MTDRPASAKKTKQPEAVIPTDEIKKEDTKGDKRGHGRTNKGPNAVEEKTDRKNISGQKRVTPNVKRNET